MKILITLSLCLLFVGCTSLPEPNKTPQLYQLKNLDQTAELAKNHRDAVEKIHAYPTKKEFWDKFKFWKKFKRQRRKVTSKVNPTATSTMEEVVLLGTIQDSSAEEVSISSEDITNNQEEHVDEGGIVKRLEDHMIILRQGKLYSLHIGETLSKGDEIAIQTKNWQHDAWYDEILVHKNTIIVIGYSYETNASEYLFFTLNKQGKFSRGPIHLVDSTDYFSSENYASRLIDGNLVFLLKNIPILNEDEDQEDNNLTNLDIKTATVSNNGARSTPHSLFSSHKIYAPLLAGYYEDEINSTTIAICPLDKSSLNCEATTILGGYTDITYTSREAYYLWLTGSNAHISFEKMSNKQLKKYAWHDYFSNTTDNNHAVLYRVPINQNDEVRAIKVKGTPLNQFSFKEIDNTLVFFTQVEDTDAFFTDAFLASIELSSLNQNIENPSAIEYFEIQKESSYLPAHRFIDHAFVYSEESLSDTTNLDETIIKVFDTKSKRITQDFTLEGSIEQIHPVGKNALLIGYDDLGDTLNYSSLSLTESSGIIETIALEDYEISESRSHGFGYRENTQGGIFAIPFDLKTKEKRNWKKENGIYYQLKPTTDIIYTQLHHNLSMNTVGALQQNRYEKWVSEGDCEVSCTDWYGSARPIFWGDRIFSLIKNELIEGEFDGKNLIEKSRLNF